MRASFALLLFCSFALLLSPPPLLSLSLASHSNAQAASNKAEKCIHRQRGRCSAVPGAAVVAGGSVALGALLLLLLVLLLGRKDLELGNSTDVV